MTNNNSFILVKANGKWNCAKSPIPTLLAEAGVSQQLWEETYDRVVKLQHEFSTALQAMQNRNELGNWVVFLFMTCFSLFLLSLVVPDPNHPSTVPASMSTVYFVFVLACVIFALYRRVNLYYLVRDYDSKVLGWRNFVRERQLLFQRAGVQLQLLTTRPVGSIQKRGKLIVGGLGFSLVGSTFNRAIPTASTAASTSTPRRTTLEDLETVSLLGRGAPSRRNMLEDLESLQRLLDQGTLTEAEFQQAKAKIWQDHGMVVSHPLAEAQLIPADQNSVGGFQDPLSCQCMDQDDFVTASVVEIV